MNIYMVDYDPPRQITPIFNPLDYRLREASAATIADLTELEDEIDAIQTEIDQMGVVYANFFPQTTLTGGTGVSFNQYAVGLNAGVYVAKYVVYANLAPTSTTYIYQIALNVTTTTQKQSNSPQFIANNFKYQSAMMVAYLNLTTTQTVNFSCAVSTPFAANPLEVVTLNNPTYFPGLGTTAGAGASLCIYRVK